MNKEAKTALIHNVNRSWTNLEGYAKRPSNETIEAMSTHLMNLTAAVVVLLQETPTEQEKR